MTVPSRLDDWAELPAYVGTVVPAPSGRIPTHLFTSEPSLDKFEWDQSMIGYRFETTIDPSRSLLS